MALPKFSRLEMRIMEVLWGRGRCSVRDIQEAFPERGRPAISTIQTTVYRLEAKGGVRCVRKIGTARIFEAAVSRENSQGRLIDEVLSLLGNSVQPLVGYLVESGKLKHEDVKEARKMLQTLARKDKTP